MSALMFGVGALAALKQAREPRTPSAEVLAARDLLATLPEFCALSGPNSVRARVAQAQSIAEGLLLALGVRAQAEHLKAIENALVLCADHELNASAFTARVAASGRAELEACLSAALAALSGNQHGGMCSRIERLVTQLADARSARRHVAECRRNRQTVPGFGHPLYPNGDPRSVPLLAQARSLNAGEPRLRVLLSLVAAMSEHAAPTLDTGLVALAFALNLRPHAATAIFAVGRSAGLIAHVFEQREANFLLRPRARYVPSDSSHPVNTPADPIF